MEGRRLTISWPGFSRSDYPSEKVLDEIEKQSGILYDSHVVKACLDLFRKRGYKAPIKEGIVD